MLGWHRPDCRALQVKIEIMFKATMLSKEAEIILELGDRETGCSTVRAYKE